MREFPDLVARNGLKTLMRDPCSIWGENSPIRQTEAGVGINAPATTVLLSPDSELRYDACVLVTCLKASWRHYDNLPIGHSFNPQTVIALAELEELVIAHALDCDAYRACDC